MQQSTFSEIADLALRHTGQALSPSKSYLVEARLSAICRRESLASLDDVVHCLKARPNPRFEAEIAAALTSKRTTFFSGADQIERIVQHALPDRLKQSKAGRLRILCAGVSTGQEAYSLAIRLAEVADTPLGTAQIEILGTDVSARAIAAAETGSYSHFDIQKGLSVERMMNFFSRQESGDWQASSALRDKVGFRQHNILTDLSSLGQFDVILFRNVLSGMSRQKQGEAIEQIGKLLLPGGYVFVGENETLTGLSETFEPSRTVRGAFVTGVLGTPGKGKIAAA